MAPKAVKELFTEINRAEPVTLVDLPDGGASPADNAVLTGAAEEMRRRYPEMFKPSHGCRPPHLNVDVLRNEMHKADLLRRHVISTEEELLAWLEKRNEALAARDDDAWASGGGGRARSSSALSKALAKARAQSFFLGLDYEWLR